MAYENLGRGALDYYPCRYGESKLLFRGPAKRLEGDFAAFIGGTETYGKFIARPFPALIESITGLECVNFGCINAGVDVFSHETAVLGACSQARITVLQVMGAQNMSNRFYTVHRRRNDRFLRASALMTAIFREVDFTVFNFTRHMLMALKSVSEDRFIIVMDELQEAWLARMQLLLEKIEGKTILLWIANHTPDEEDALTGLGEDPLFVNRKMIEAVRPMVTAVVEVIPSDRALARGTEGMKFSQLEAPAARHSVGLGTHEEVASALIEPLGALI